MRLIPAAANASPGAKLVALLACFQLWAASPLWAAAAAQPPHSPLIHHLLSFGLIGVFLISIVDSSFVPLPIPGITDILVIVLAAKHANLFLLIGAATAGSVLGGAFSYRVGHAGGTAFLERHVSPRVYARICGWMNENAILSVALPAILPPPMPLSPFVLAAGALRMSERKFLIVFTLSRFVRHAIAATIGVYFGTHVIHLWNSFSGHYSTPILVVLWTAILLCVAFAFWRLYQTSRSLRTQT